MTREIYVKQGEQTELAVVEDGRLVEYLRDTGKASDAESIYLGKVERIASGMNAAFVNIGQKRNGFLPLEEKSLSFVSNQLRCGDRVLVQVKREAHDQKGAFLTRDVTLCGQYVLLMPCNRYIGVSAKVEGESRRRLQQLGHDLARDRFGLVMRTSAENADTASVLQETEALYGRWQEIIHQAATAPAPSVIAEEKSLLDSTLRDYAPRGIDRIVLNSQETAKLLQDTYPTDLTDDNLMETAHLISQRNQALQRTVQLPGGGNLVIDQCEALTAIDVNSARFTGEKVLEETVCKVNLEACDEIVRQLRLRNLGGVIIIDFIDMKEEASRRMVEERLRQACLRDRMKTVVHGFTSLGLMEMTRKRLRRTLRDEWTISCPACAGTGRVRCKEEEHG